MTTEEMNRIIAGYMGYELVTPRYAPHDDWTTLMPVWQKLRGELRVFRTNTPISNMKYVQAYDLENSIKEAITEEDTPTTAHRLIVEAITLIKK